MSCLHKKNFLWLTFEFLLKKSISKINNYYINN
jgi:hypothetical protein